MKSSVFILPLVAFALAVSGCGGSANGVVGIHNPRIRAVNDFSDVSAVSATVDNKSLLTSQPFGDVSAYAIITNGNRDIAFTDVSGASSIPIIDQTSLLETEKYYTAIGTGSGSGGRHIILLEDGSVIANNMAKARIVNANEDFNSVDVYFTSQSTANLTGQTAQMTSVGYGTAVVDYTTFAPGDYKIWITPAGNQTPISTMNVTLSANTIVTYVFAKSSSGDTIQTLQDRPLPSGTP